MTTSMGVLMILIPSVIAITAGYLAIKTEKRFALHRIVVASFVILAIGILFKLLHLAGADQILMISYIGQALGGFLLIWTGLRNPTGKILFFQLISGILVSLFVLDRFAS